MKILDKAARLEKALLDRIGRRSDIARHPIEVYRAILEDIEGATEPGGRGTRIFPYNVIEITVRTTGAHHRATAEAVFAEPPAIHERVRHALKHAGCADVDDIAVSLTFDDNPSSDGSDRDYRIEFGRRAVGRPKPAPRAKRPQETELVLGVAAGSASKTRYTFKSARINIGRLSDVADRQHRIVRHNQVAFADTDDEVSQSVSRAHAHVRFDSATGEAHLHDDGSTHGTRVVRAGRTIDVPRGGSRGVKLKNGDEVLLGQARLKVEFRPARRR